MTGSIALWRGPGVDEEPLDLVMFQGEEVREALLEIREAVELALTGLKQAAPK